LLITSTNIQFCPSLDKAEEICFFINKASGTIMERREKERKGKENTKDLEHRQKKKKKKKGRE